MLALTLVERQTVALGSWFATGQQASHLRCALDAHRCRLGQAALQISGEAFDVEMTDYQ